VVVISGKGGTGKTSIASCFFALAERAAAADCDVDAADLHLVVDPSPQDGWAFSGGQEARIDATACTGCGLCAEHCRFDALRLKGEVYEVDSLACDGCGVCADICPEQAARMVPSVNGEWFVSSTPHGPLVHARLGVAQENSGRLVSLLRREARALVDSRSLSLLIADGSPGIGCPVIASITGTQLAIVVTEPTLSGLHDMKRAAELTRHFRVKTAVCINKADINPELSARLEEEARELGLPVLGRIRYDPAVTRAQVQGKPVVENGDSPAATEIRALWERVRHALT
jgi:MinD superfamily P-loop ATPase